MRSIRYILLSYMQMEFTQMFFLFLSLFWFLVAHIKILEGDGFHDGFFSVWHLFLISMIFEKDHVDIIIPEIGIMESINYHENI